MLINLYIKDFAIVENLDIDIDSGMTTITGETGAGKSISIDALSLCLGARAEAGMVRNGADKTEVCATFNLAGNQAAIDWLIAQDMYEADQNEYIIRRVISAEGRSRAYINGAPVPAQLLKSFSEFLVNIHGQHAHQLLLKPEQQLSLVDQYAGHKHLVSQATMAYQGWSKLNQELKTLQQQKSDRDAKLQLLEYQVSELDEFNLLEGEFEAIEDEYKRLSNASTLVSDSQYCYSLLSDNEEQSIASYMQKVVNKLTELSRYDNQLNNVAEMISEANIQVTEASYELRDYLDSIELNPERLTEIDERMSAAMNLARKHKVPANELYLEHQKLANELSEIKRSEQQNEALIKDVATAEKQYWIAAEALSKSRQDYACELSEKITLSMQNLNMQQGVFNIELKQSDKMSKLGADLVDFQVCANPGQPLQALSKVASGGELSRISLAIQVLTASKISTPTLIFDEVDVGISGGTAAIVGQMLRQIGESTQVMCVTHLPQVAACGHQQMQVQKENTTNSTQTNMVKLSKEERIQELARLLGGDKITHNTIENARDLLVS